MNVLVVGYGSMGRRHARHAQALGHRVMVEDESPAAGQEALHDGHLLWDGEVPDAAVVATPVARHAEMIEDLCWVPLLVEKPLAPSVAELEAVGVTARTTHIAVGYNWRFHPDVRLWRDRWPEVPDRLELACLTDMATWPGQHYGDPLLECSHEIDLLQWLRGDALRVVRQRQDGKHAELLFENGDTVRAEWRHAGPARRIFEARKASEWTHTFTIDPAAPQLEESYRLEMQAFLRFAQTGERGDLASAADGIAVLEACGMGMAR